jgi:hypothetical protein
MRIRRPLAPEVPRQRLRKAPAGRALCFRTTEGHRLGAAWRRGSREIPCDRGQRLGPCRSGILGGGPVSSSRHPAGAPQDEHLPVRHSWSESSRFLPRTFVRPAQRFMRIEAAAGVVMLVAAVAALLLVNSPLHGAYESLWTTEVTLRVGSITQFDHLTLRDWVNDGAMGLFFFLVVLEIKRELVSGELRDPRAAALPVFGALGAWSCLRCSTWASRQAALQRVAGAFRWPPTSPSSRRSSPSPAGGCRPPRRSSCSRWPSWTTWARSR